MDYWDLAAMGAAGAISIGCAAIGRQEAKHVAWSAALGAAYLAVFAVQIYLSKRVAGKHEADRQSRRNQKRAAGQHLQKRAAGRHLLNQTAGRYLQNQAAGQHSREKMIIAIMLLAVVLTEFTVVSYNAVTTVRTTEREIYPNKYDEMQQVLDMREPADSGFYRTETVNWYSTNDPSLYGFEGISIFSSTVNRNTTSYLLGLGLYAGLAGNRYIYSQSTPLVNAFLNIRYLVSRSSDIPDSSIYWQRTGSSGDAVLIENNYSLPFGFMTGTELAGYERTEDDPFASQNDLFRLATGLDGDLFTKQDIVHVDYRGYDVTRRNLGDYSFVRQQDAEEKQLKWNYEMPVSGPLYVYVKIDRPESVKVLLDNKEIRSRRSPYPVLFCAGTFNKGDLVSVTCDPDRASGKAIIYAAVIDHELFERGYDILSADTLDLTEFSGTRVKGTVNAERSGLLYTSIPYEKGWRVFVDGTEQEIVLIDDCMAAVPLDAGMHEVEFRYINDGLIPGAVITVISLLIFIATAVIVRTGHVVRVLR